MVRKSGSEYVSPQRPPAMMLAADAAATISRPRGRVDTRSAVSARRIAAHQDTPPILPSPIATEAVVVPDYAARTLFVRLGDTVTGQVRAAWAKGYAALQQEETYNSRTPTLWAATKSAEKVAHGVAGEAGMLRFFFPVGGGNTAFSELVGKPRLYAIVTCDRATGFFLRCLFLHR